MDVSVFKSAFFQIRTGTAMISLPKEGNTTWLKTIHTNLIQDQPGPPGDGRPRAEGRRSEIRREQIHPLAAAFNDLVFSKVSNVEQ